MSPLFGKILLVLHDDPPVYLVTNYGRDMMSYMGVFGRVVQYCAFYASSIPVFLAVITGEHGS